MRVYSNLVRQLGRTRGFAWVASRVLPPIDNRFHDHPLTTLGTDFPLCYLTVRGRKSGEQRTVPLLFVRDVERVVLIASNWGQAHHPAWALNLDAAGEASVEIPGEGVRAMTSRRAVREEFERYWADALRFWPGYEGYRRRASREIRMFVLDPVR